MFLQRANPARFFVHLCCVAMGDRLIDDAAPFYLRWFPQRPTFRNGSDAQKERGGFSLPAHGKKTSSHGMNPWVRAGRSGIHGHGVYARVDISDGTRIIEYVGERITKAEARRRELARLERQRRGEDASVYVFELNRRYDLDGRTSRNLARLINHSCAPNCRAETIRGCIWIIARRDIPAGAELTFDYGFSLADGKNHPCRCGAKRCAGFIVNAGQRWRLRRRRS